jgi:hypothetical protein
MTILDNSYLQDKDKLAPYAQEILEGVIPLLERLDSDKLAPNSFVLIGKERDGFVLLLNIVPNNKDIPLLNLYATFDQCILGFADSEQVEAHSIPNEYQGLVSIILATTERYFNGITIIEHYNKNHKMVKKEYFYGIDKEDDIDSRIGTSSYFVFPTKVISVLKRTHRFLK